MRHVQEHYPANKLTNSSSSIFQAAQERTRAGYDEKAYLPRPWVKDHRARMLHVRGIARRQCQACHRSRGCQ